MHRSKAGTLLSALGRERTSTVHLPMSTLPPKADIERGDRHDRFVPIASECTACGCLLPNAHVDLDAELVGAIRQLPHQFILAHAIEVGIFMLDSS